MLFRSEASAEDLIDVEGFFSIPIVAKGGKALVGGLPLEAKGREIELSAVPDGEIG